MVDEQIKHKYNISVITNKEEIQMKKIIKGLAIVLTSIALIGAATIKDVQMTEYGTQITFRDNTGYFIEK